MTPQDLLLQRLVDGRLSPHEVAGLERAAQDDAALASRLRAVTLLHQDLATAAPPMAADEHHALLGRIAAALPATRPQAYARVRALDLVLALGVLVLIGLAFVTAGSVMKQGLAMLTLACLGVVSGTFVLTLASMLRRAEAGLLRRLLGRPVTVGPADTLVYRTAGAALFIGGVYLALLS